MFSLQSENEMLIIKYEATCTTKPKIITFLSTDALSLNVQHTACVGYFVYYVCIPKSVSRQICKGWEVHVSVYSCYCFFLIFQALL